MTITEFQQACSAIEQDYKTKISQAADLAAVEELRVAALGRKGALTELLKGLKDFSIEEKKEAATATTTTTTAPKTAAAKTVNRKATSKPMTKHNSRRK